MNKEEGSGTAEIPCGLRRNWDPTLQERKFVRICLVDVGFIKSNTAHQRQIQHMKTDSGVAPSWLSERAVPQKASTALPCLVFLCRAVPHHAILYCPVPSHVTISDREGKTTQMRRPWYFLGALSIWLLFCALPSHAYCSINFFVSTWTQHCLNLLCTQEPPNPSCSLLAMTSTLGTAFSTWLRSLQSKEHLGSVCSTRTIAL